MSRVSFPPSITLPLAIAMAATLALGAAEMSLDEGKGTLRAESGEFDLGQGTYHFEQNVQFRYPGMLDLDCADLTIRFLPGGQRIDRLIASNDVVMTLVQRPSTNSSLPMNRKGTTNRIHAAVAEFTGTNDVVTLTGSPSFGQPWVEGAEGSFRADVITFDRAKNKIGIRGNFQMTIEPGAIPKGALAPSKPVN